MPGSILLFTMTLLSALGFMLIGYDNGVMGGIINNPPFNDTFGSPDAGLLGTIVAIYEIGCFVGAILCSIVGERLGRRKSILLGAAVMLVGAVFQTASNNVGELIAARVISGLGMGFINSTCPVLQSEISPPRLRGRFICFSLTLLNSGIMLAYWVGYGFTPLTGSVAWRCPVALQLVFIIPMIILCFVVPESPRWLASHGRADDSLDVLARLLGKSTNDSEAVAMHAEILQSVELEKSVKGSWRDILMSDNIKSRRRFLIACSIQFFQQIGGINALIYYAGNFLKLSSDRPDLLAGALFTWFFVASFIPWFLIDSWGRRKLLLACIAGMTACFAIEAGTIYKVSNDGDRGAANAATAFLFVYMGLFTIGFQAVVWVYPSEILPLKIRQKGSSISTACNWITNFFIVEITPTALQNISWKYYIVFACINAAFLPPIYFFYPETKGMTLESVDRLFAGDASSADTKPTAVHVEAAGHEKPTGV